VGKSRFRVSGARCQMGSAVLPQIRALESNGKLAIVSPQRRTGCAALMPEHSFTREHCEAALDFHDEVYGNGGETLPGGAR
jgi:hypothetical protein